VQLERWEGIEMVGESKLFGPPGSPRRIVSVALIIVLLIPLIWGINTIVQASPSLTQYQKSRVMELFSTSAGMLLGLLLILREFFEVRPERKIRWHLLGLGILLLTANIWLMTTLAPIVFGGN
jgi:uncharacterized membrane protein